MLFRSKKRNLTMPHRCDAKRHRRAMEGHHPLATVGRPNEDERIAEEYSRNYREDASPSSAGYDWGWDSGAPSGARFAAASAVLANAVRTDVGPGIGCSLFVGQRTFETRSRYLIVADVVHSSCGKRDATAVGPVCRQVPRGRPVSGGLSQS